MFCVTLELLSNRILFQNLQLFHNLLVQQFVSHCALMCDSDNVQFIGQVWTRLIFIIKILSIKPVKMAFYLQALPVIVDFAEFLALSCELKCSSNDSYCDKVVYNSDVMCKCDRVRVLQPYWGAESYTVFLWSTISSSCLFNNQVRRI